MKALRVAVVPYAEALGLRVVPVRPAPPACPYVRARCALTPSRCSGGFAFYNITCTWSWLRDACAPAPLDRCTTQPWVWL